MTLLNQAQQKAVNTLNGNLLILASAGTGKTTTIVERYLNLVTNHNYSANEIMMTTFTNKAAKDMILKIKNKTDKVSPYIGTMHSLFLKILRQHASLLGYKENFTLIDEEDKTKIAKNLLKEHSLDSKADNVHYLLTSITKFKNRGILPESLDPKLKTEDQTGVKELLIDDTILYIDAELKNLIPLLYTQYAKHLQKNNLLDLDDILLLTYKLFQNNSEIKQYYSDKFKIIMVDEAQDLNYVQMSILNLLQRDNLCLIGDDCQNIYEWRGSSNDLVFKFNEHYNTILLKENYRSTKQIIEGVNKTIKAMKSKIEKELICTREKGKEINLESFYTNEEEINYLIQEVKTLLSKNVEKEKIALLFRTNAIGKTLEREFLKNKIPCHLAKGRNFFEREEIKDLLSFLKLKVNPSSFPDFERVALLLEGLGQVTIKNIQEYARKYDLAPLEIIYSKELGLSTNAKDKLASLKKVLDNTKDNPIPLFFGLFHYAEQINRKYKNDPPKAKEKIQNLNVLTELFEGYSFSQPGIQEFLDSLLDLEKREKDKDKITLSTIHSAKGLEWEHVYLISCNEGILPYYREELSTLERDSELRLFYVALSRAKDHLTLTYSQANEWKQLYPSSFLQILF